MKKEYKIQSKSTNGIWVNQGYKEFDSDGEAKTFARNKSIERGFEYRAKFIRNLKSESVENVDEVEEQDKVETKVEEVEEQTEENEEKVDGDDVEKIDYDFADDHDTDNFPQGWWLKKEFVAKDGTVFKFKKEQPHLYRTLKPSEY